MRERATTFSEAPRLAGVVCDPETGGLEERPAFVFLNAGILHRVGPSRIHVHLARALGRDGHPSLRFDFSGFGDSENPRDGLPFRDRGVAEAGRAMDYLKESLGSRQFILVGLCSGAEVGHASGVADPRVVGIVPMDGHIFRTPRFYLHRYGPRLIRLESWLNLLRGRTYLGPFIRRLVGPDPGPTLAEGSEVFEMDRPAKAEIEADLQQLVDRGVRMLQIFTGGMDDLCTYQGQFEEAFASIDFEELLQVEFFSEADHTFTSPRDQQRLVETVAGWARECWPRVDERPAPAPAEPKHERGRRRSPSAGMTDPAP